MAGDLLLGGAPQRPQPRHLSGVGVEPAVGIEQAAMGRDLDQCAIVMLAVNFDEGRADGTQHLHRHRLIVEEGAGSPVGELDPAQDELVLRRNVVCCEGRPRRMIERHVEGGRDLALLGALAHEPGVAAPAERQRKRIEQDRFTGAGLASEHREPRRKVDVEAVDQDDVSDREPGQHQGPRRPRIAAAAFFVRTREPNIQYAARLSIPRDSGVEPVCDQRSVITPLNLRPSATIHYPTAGTARVPRVCRPGSSLWRDDETGRSAGTIAKKLGTR